MMLGGNDPLPGISAYKNASPRPHWHFVTYGFSELYEKETDDPELSGYGFELTFRLAQGEGDSDEPPPWPLSFLQNLARYVFTTGNAFDERHHMTLNGPIAIGLSTHITAIMLILDPELREIDTRNGHVKFLQIVGLCEDEYRLIQQGYFDQIGNRVAALAPLAITDIFRTSILREKSVLDAITSTEPDSRQREVFGTIVEGSETAGQLQIRIGATIIPQLKRMFRNLAADGKSIAVYGKGTGVVFQVGNRVDWREDESLLIVSLTTDTAALFGENLQPIRGEYKSESDGTLRIVVVPIDIRDREGNVVETVG
jgi:suppressor of fused-like protein